jgi:transforming growth factor-beta-induced protein
MVSSFVSMLVLAMVAGMVLSAPTALPNIVELAEATASLSTLVTALKAGDLVTPLEGPGPFTVFAPTNDAFAALPAGVLQHLLEPANKKELDFVLEYHVVAGAAVYASQLKNREAIKMLNGDDVEVFLAHDSVYINYAKVILANVNASNGVVHVIDHVLIPRTVYESMARQQAHAAGLNIVQLAESDKDLSTLVTAVAAGGLVSVLESPGPFTVFAPTNEAFAALPAGVLAKLLEPANKAELVAILTYHVVAGAAKSGDLYDRESIKTVEGGNVTVYIPLGSVYINYAQVITANLMATNGVVHIIDRVLLPPALAAKYGVESSGLNIVQLAESDKDLSTLVTAVAAGGLVSVLESPGPFTVFAPTNEAFAALPAGVLAKLLEPANKAELVAILTYHVVSGAAKSTDLYDRESIKTVQGGNVTVYEPLGSVFINYAQVITANLMATNGVVHIIDKVLLPPALADKYNKYASISQM